MQQADLLSCQRGPCHFCLESSRLFGQFNDSKNLFDDSYLDLCQLLLVGDSDIDIDRDPRIGSLLPRITNAIRGKYQIKKDR